MKFTELVEKEGVELHAFVCCGHGTFEATILANLKTRRSHESDAIDLVADSAEQLEQLANVRGLTLGDVSVLEANCRSAQRSPRSMR